MINNKYETIELCTLITCYLSDSFKDIDFLKSN